MNIQSLISKLKQAKKRRVIFDYHRSPKNGVDISTEDWIWIAPFLYGLFKELKSMKYTITITWWGEIFVIYKGADTAFELTLNYQSSVPYTYEFTQRVRDKTHVIHTISTRQTALNLGLKAYRTGTKWFYIPLGESTATPASAACKINEVMQSRLKEYSFAGWSVKPDIATSDDIAAAIHYGAALFGLGSRFDYISKKLLELIIYQDIEQHRIYYNQINLFLSHHALLSAAQVIDLLSTPTKPFTEQDLKKLIDENKAFFVTAPNFAGYEGYPAFQFDIYKRRVKPILEPIIEQVSKYYFDWDIVLWLGSYFGELNSSAIEAIDEPKQHCLLIQLAKNIENECL